MKGGLNPKTIGLLAMAALVLGGGAIYLQYNAMSGASARYKTLEAEVPDEAELREELTATETELAMIQTKLDHLEKGVPPVAYIPTLLKELEQTGQMSQIKVTGVRPAPRQPSPPGALEEEAKAYEEKDIDIAGRGNFRAIIAMLDQLQKFPKVVAVGTVGMNPKMVGTSPNYEHLEVTVRLKAYVFPETKQEAEAVKPVASLDAAPKPQGGA